MGTMGGFPLGALSQRPHKGVVMSVHLGQLVGIDHGY